jgi:hypothetical protein
MFADNGGSIILPTPTENEGYIFDGWYISDIDDTLQG